MMVTKKILRTGLLVGLMSGVLLLSGCNSNTVLSVHSDNTYSVSTDLQQSSLNQPKKCEDHFPGLDKQLKNPHLKIKDTSTPNEVRCHLELTKQPISSAKSPFVTIKHIGDHYQVSLPPAKELGFISGGTDSFRLQVDFPGPILESNSPLGHISGHTIWWDDPSVIVNGFTVSGQDHPGVTRAHKMWVLLGWTVLGGVIIGAIWLALPWGRRGRKQVVAVMRRLFRPLSNGVLRLAELIALHSSSNSSSGRGRRGRKPGSTSETRLIDSEKPES